MGEIIAGKMLSYFELLINRYYCLYFVVHIIESLKFPTLEQISLYFLRRSDFFIEGSICYYCLWTHDCVVTGSTFTSAYTTKHLFVTDDVIQLFKEANRRINFYSSNKRDITNVIYFGIAVLAGL